MSVVKPGSVTVLPQVWKPPPQTIKHKKSPLLVGQNVSDKSMFLNEEIWEKKIKSLFCFGWLVGLGFLPYFSMKLTENWVRNSLLHSPGNKIPCISRRNAAFSYNFPIISCTCLVTATRMLSNNHPEVGIQVYPGYFGCNFADKTRQIIYLPFHILQRLHYPLQGKQQSLKHYRRKDVLPSITVTFEITRGSAEIIGL